MCNLWFVQMLQARFVYSILLDCSYGFVRVMLDVFYFGLGHCEDMLSSISPSRRTTSADPISSPFSAPLMLQWRWTSLPQILLARRWHHSRWFCSKPPGVCRSSSPATHGGWVPVDVLAAAPATAPHVAEHRHDHRHHPPPPTALHVGAPLAQALQVQVRLVRQGLAEEPLDMTTRPTIIHPIQLLATMATKLPVLQQATLVVRFPLARLTATQVPMPTVDLVEVVQRLLWLQVQAFWQVT